MLFEKLALEDRKFQQEDKRRKQEEKRAEAAKKKAEAIKSMLTAKTPDLLRLCNKEADEKINNNPDTALAEMGKVKVCAWGTILDDIALGDKCKKDAEKENYVEKVCTELAGFDISQKIAQKVVKDVQTGAKKMDKLIVDNKTSGQLAPGVYKVVVAGGAGGNGGGADPHCFGRNKASGGSGGNGSIEEQVFTLTKLSSFSATIGKKGNSKGWTSHGGKPRGDKGDNGTPSTFKIDGIVDITAAAGEGGGGGAANACHWKQNGSTGSSGGNGKNSGEGSVQVYGS